MNTLPIADDASRSINERFIAYLDALYSPRDFRRRLLVAGTMGGTLLVGLILALALVKEVHSVWPLLPIGVVLVARGIIALQGIRKAREQFRHLRNVVQHGIPVTAYVVQAYETLYHPGRDTLPCLVLFTFSPEVEHDADYMHYLAEKLYKMKNTQPDDPEGRYLASLTTDESPVPYRRRRLPLSFTDGSTIYCADLWVKRAYLRDGYLNGNALLCLAEPGEIGGIELIPAWLLNPTEKRVLAHHQE